MVTGVFTRADHPRGWGFLSGGDGSMRAHGYSVLLVRCSDVDELDAVARKLAYNGTDLPDHSAYEGGHKRGYQWYSGKFDLVFSFLGPFARGGWDFADKPILSIGDNRCLCVFDAATVLAERPELTSQPTP